MRIVLNRVLMDAATSKTRDEMCDKTPDETRHDMPDKMPGDVQARARFGSRITAA